MNLEVHNRERVQCHHKYRFIQFFGINIWLNLVLIISNDFIYSDLHREYILLSINEDVTYASYPT